VPPTVQAILASRIDRLAAAEKELLQTLAVVGREFRLGQIKRVTGKSEDELEPMLSELQLAEFVHEQPAFPDTEYTFKHALTQEVAYSSVLVERRRLLHERAAQAIEELFADRLEDHVNHLAHHFDRAGNIPKAMEYLSRSGARAAQQMAHAEAIGNFTRALELLRELPDGAARNRQELDLQMVLSWSLFVARGPRAPELDSALLRARELSERLGDDAKLMEALLALAETRNSRGDFEQAREVAERLLVMAEQAKAPAMLAGAYFVLGLVQFVMAQFPAAREHLERAVELSGAGPFRNYLALFAQAAPNILGEILIILGYPSTGLSRTHELLAAARQSCDPFSLASALVNDCMRHLLLRDTRMMAERADELFSIATENEIPRHSIYATFFRAWAMAAAGRGDEGIAGMRRSISDPAVAESPIRLPFFWVLAEICGKNARIEEGLDLATKGLAAAEQSGERAEPHRLKGELLMIKDPLNVEEAERCIRTAIDVARRQSARLFELRATLSLARLLKSQRKIVRPARCSPRSITGSPRALNLPT
jgi:tetratricopeptide (TPR) repeat protein